MAVQASVALRNNMIGQYESTVGVSPKLQIRSGAQPTDCTAADSGTLICEITLPSDWMATASAGSISKLGTWSNTAAAAGTAAHYRLKDSAGTTCHEQGTVSITGGGGDLTLDGASTAIAAGQTVTVTTWTRTQSGA
jgi:hypothetical protein